MHLRVPAPVFKPDCLFLTNFQLLLSIFIYFQPFPITLYQFYPFPIIFICFQLFLPKFECSHIILPIFLYHFQLFSAILVFDHFPDPADNGFLNWIKLGLIFFNLVQLEFLGFSLGVRVSPGLTLAQPDWPRAKLTLGQGQGPAKMALTQPSLAPGQCSRSSSPKQTMQCQQTGSSFGR